MKSPGLYAWKNTADDDPPYMVVNASDHPAVFLKLPPHSVAVHPSPKAGVAIAWRSPFTGSARITGKVADADPNCGDGVEWKLEQHQAGGKKELASGSIPNGGAQSVLINPQPLEIKAGDMIQGVIAGFIIDEDKQGNGFSSLIIAQEKDRGYKYVGQVGTGVPRNAIDKILKMLIKFFFIRLSYP